MKTVERILVSKRTGHSMIGIRIAFIDKYEKHLLSEEDDMSFTTITPMKLDGWIVQYLEGQTSLYMQDKFVRKECIDLGEL